MNYFSTLLPPPNLTGILHLGHMWNAILQDTLIRYYSQILGKERCYWGFGVDHAGISLQIKVEEELRREGIDKRDLSKEEFSSKLWEWKEIHDRKITEQYLSLGYALPLEEKRFTLDGRSVEYTLNVFRRLYLDGFIYRDEKLVNWDPKLNTAISDIEIEHRATNVKLYTVKYYYSDVDYISVSTTRPETILGDVAIFVHPSDERYVDLVGKKVKVPLTDRFIEILVDEYIDSSFSTGAMKCTPAHDFHDYLLFKKHNLSLIKVFNTDLKMLIEPYKGLHKDKAKDLIVEELIKQGLVDIEDYQSNISYSSRSGSVVEPLLSKQWFLKSSLLAKQALDYWDKHIGDMRVTKESKQEELRGMLENMEDWCISRQLEWGIKLPVYLNETEHDLEPRLGLLPSNDVLDTWFSSALWPHIVFQDRPNLLPLSVLISGKDILLFWISRMIFMSVYAEGVLPFKNIFLHGLILDSKNRKMSKSLNNGIDPVALIQEYSHDTVRLFFLANTHQDSNIAFSKQKLEHYSKFIHKLKNAYIFVRKEEDIGSISALNFNEKQILFLVREMRGYLDKQYRDFRFNDVADKLVDFVWDRFCNNYLELYKVLENHRKNTTGFLRAIWNEVLLLLGPVIPDFVSGKRLESNLDISNLEIGEYRNIDWFFEYINTYSYIRKHLSIPKDRQINIKIFTSYSDNYEYLIDYFQYLNHKVIYIGPRIYMCSDNSLVFAVYKDNLDFVVEMELEAEIVDRYKEILVERKSWLRNEIEFLSNRIKGFSDRTPVDLIESVKGKLSRYQKDLKFFEENYK